MRGSGLCELKVAYSAHLVTNSTQHAAHSTQKHAADSTQHTARKHHELERASDWFVSH